MDEVIEGVRGKKIVHHPDMFAGVPSDPVNGRINTDEFLDGSIIYESGRNHRDRRRMLNHLMRPEALHSIREDIIIPAAERLLVQRLSPRTTRTTPSVGSEEPPTRLIPGRDRAAQDRD